MKQFKTNYFICSSCNKKFRLKVMHTLPYYNEYVQTILFACRCDKCWEGSYHELINIINGLNEDIKKEFVGFFKTWFGDKTAIELDKLSVDDGRERLLRFMKILSATDCTILNSYFISTKYLIQNNV